jgi:hypothetical protein
MDLSGFPGWKCSEDKNSQERAKNLVMSFEGKQEEPAALSRNQHHGIR